MTSMEYRKYLQALEDLIIKINNKFGKGGLVLPLEFLWSRGIGEGTERRYSVTRRVPTSQGGYYTEQLRVFVWPNIKSPEILFLGRRRKLKW